MRAATPQRRMRPVKISEDEIMCTCSQCSWASPPIAADKLETGRAAFGLHRCEEYPPYPVRPDSGKRAQIRTLPNDPLPMLHRA